MKLETKSDYQTIRLNHVALTTELDQVMCCECRTTKVKENAK